MEMPWNCQACGYENMIDMDNLFEWPLDKLVTAQGFTCENCGMREAIAHRTASLSEAERKLTRHRPGSSQFQWQFQKLVRKAEGLNARGELHGALKHKDVAFPG